MFTKKENILITKLIIFASILLLSINLTVWVIGKLTRGLPDIVRYLSAGFFSYSIIALLMSCTDLISIIDDHSFDLMNEIFVDTNYIKSPSQNYIFIDIDEKTYDQWNYPLLSPRDKIADLIQIVMASDPLVMVVDLDLTDEGIDVKAASRLKSLLEKEKIRDKAILMRNVRGTKDQVKYATSFYFEKIQLDPVAWSIPFFEADDEDFLIRKWNLNKSVKLQQQLMEVISPQQIIRDRFVSLNSHSKTDERTSFQRIFYSYTYDFNPNFLGNLKKGFFRYSASDVIEAGRLPGKTLKDSVVILGASHSYSKDIWRTPVGSMPGSVIILNAIKSLLDYGWLQKLSVFVSIIIAFIILIIFYKLYVPINTLFTRAELKISSMNFNLVKYNIDLKNITDFLMGMRAWVMVIIMNVIFWPSSYLIYKVGLWPYIFPLTLIIPFTFKYLALNSTKNLNSSKEYKK